MRVRHLPTLKLFFNGIFAKHRFIDIIADFTLTMGVDKRHAMAGYPIFAVKKALDCTKKAPNK